MHITTLTDEINVSSLISDLKDYVASDDKFDTNAPYVYNDVLVVSDDKLILTVWDIESGSVFNQDEMSVVVDINGANVTVSSGITDKVMYISLDEDDFSKNYETVIITALKKDLRNLDN